MYIVMNYPKAQQYFESYDSRARLSNDLSSE